MSDTLTPRVWACPLCGRKVSRIEEYEVIERVQPPSPFLIAVHARCWRRAERRAGVRASHHNNESESHGGGNSVAGGESSRGEVVH